MSPASGFFNSGQSVQITATPNIGLIFNGWTGSGTGSYTGSDNPATVTVNGPTTETAAFVVAPAKLQFTASTYGVTEGVTQANIAVERTGDSSVAGTVDFGTTDNTAHQNKDYTLAGGTLSFAAGEMSKNFSVLITDNAYVDGNRSVTITLSNATGGVTLGTLTTAFLTITDNDSQTPTSNPLDNPDALFFVRQQYSDFLGREPDPGGLAYWAEQVSSCGSNVACIVSRRVGASAAFFVENEFQRTCSVVNRIHRAAHGTVPG